MTTSSYIQKCSCHTLLKKCNLAYILYAFTVYTSAMETELFFSLHTYRVSPTTHMDECLKMNRDTSVGVEYM